MGIASKSTKNGLIYTLFLLFKTVFLNLLWFLISKTNLRNKITHSVQTDFSNYRRDNVTQTWLPKFVFFFWIECFYF